MHWARAAEEQAMPLLPLPCPLGDLVPHQPPMLLMDTFQAFSENRGEAEVKVRAGHLFVISEDTLHPAVVIEMLAQTAAAHEGYRRLSGGGALGGGFLASIHDFELLEGPRVDDTVRAAAIRDLQIGELQLVNGLITRGSQTIGKGELLFHLSDELMPDAFHGRRRDENDQAPRSTTQPIVKAVDSSLQSVDPQSGRAQYVFERSFPAFDGHFPYFPVLPAVVSLICAEDAVARFAGNGWSVRRIRRAKFTRPVMPGNSVDAVCTSDTHRGQGNWRVHLEVEGEVVAKLDLEGAIGAKESNPCG